MSSTGLTLGQMKMTLKDIKKMVKIILSAPLQIAGKKTLSAINFLENKQIKLTVQQFWFALQDAQQAFEFAISQGNSIENLEHAAKASQIIVLAKFCTLSYDEQSETIEPFYVLDDDKQKAIANELENDCKNFLEFHKTVKVAFFSLNKNTKNKALRSMKNTFLKALYPYISEGKKYTQAEKELLMKTEIKCDPELVPQGYENATPLILGFRKNEKNKVIESFYKDGDGYIVSAQKSSEIGFYQKCKSEIKIFLFKYFLLSPDGMKNMEFLRTTDQNPIFYAKSLKWSRNEHVKIDVRIPISLAFFLYRSAKNEWFCSPVVGEEDEFHSCVLRNKIDDTSPAARAEITDSPPLSGWEYFSKDGEWVLYDHDLPIGSFVTLDGLDCDTFISKPWESLDRSKYKDEIIVTASAENIGGAFSFVCGVYKVHKEPQFKHSGVYKISNGKSLIYKTDGGKWCIDIELGNDSPMHYNDSAPCSEWPPADGWKHFFGFSLPIELRIIIRKR
ncbi:uncharacterized protein LOC134846066 [Symsagittifera roscoffensis]|uniref:uncharacterized protein LOC134846066 n=1 Tax=Symsagittifera roscoffensis TaxID=84072 RepID=UPI00307C14CF